MLKILETRDWLTNWIENVPGSRDSGAADFYGKDPEWFATDYEAMILWCARNGIDVIGIEGLLRDRHVDYWTRDLLKEDLPLLTARRVCGYGREKGVKVVLVTKLANPGGIYYEGKSPWAGERSVTETLDWVFREIPALAGIRFNCAAKDVPADAERIIRTRRPDALILNNVRHSDAGSAAGDLGTLELEKIHDLCATAAQEGRQGVSLFGERSPQRSNAEFNYLALAYFADDPKRTVQGFVREVMALRLGGAVAAERYVAFARTWKSPADIPATVDEIVRLAGKSDDPDVCARWFSLADDLNVRHWEAKMREREVCA